MTHLNLPSLPIKCIKRMWGMKGRIEVELQPDNEECLDALQDIVLSGKFRIGTTAYSIIHVAHLGEPGYRVFKPGAVDHPPYIGLEAVVAGGI